MSDQVGAIKKVTSHGFGRICSLLRFDIAVRFMHLTKSKAGNHGFMIALILFSSLIQTSAQLVPFVSWFTWPFLVFICVDILNTQHASWKNVPKLMGKRFIHFKSQASVAFSLFLYGALGFLSYRSLTELIYRLPTASLAEGILPNEVVALLPYSIPEACALLFIGACSARYTASLQDPFSILSKGFTDLLLSPISLASLLLFQGFLMTPLAINLGIMFKMPVLSIFVGHSPFVVIGLLWACGHNIHSGINQRA
jgi:hypothetical protein